MARCARCSTQTKGDRYCKWCTLIRLIERREDDADGT